MIKVSDAGFNYHGSRVLFEKVSFEVKLGETLTILGTNGAGKTTFIKCLMNFLQFKKGSLFIDGKSAKDYRSADFWKIVGYVPQAKSAAFGFSVLEMTVMGLSPYIGMGRLPKKEEYEQAENILEELGVLDIKDASCNQISGGQLQMVLIARTLIKKPKILIMDEPESHLDLKNQMKILNIVERLNAGNKMAIVINTHFPGHALRIAKNALIMGQNNHLYGRSQDIVNKNNLSRYFGIDTEILEHSLNGVKFRGILPIGLSSGDAIYV